MVLLYIIHHCSLLLQFPNRMQVAPGESGQIKSQIGGEDGISCSFPVTVSIIAFYINRS